MKLLREKSLATKFLILIEITSGHRSRLSPIAEKLGITTQAVSDYLRKMKKDGLIQQINGEYKATKKGIQFLHSNFLELKKFTNSKMKDLNIIDACAAIAREDIEKGDKLALFMEKGNLVAYPNRESSSTGVAMREAIKGEDVPVIDLEGIIEHRIGNLCLIELPSIREGGSRSADIDEIGKILKKLNPDKIGIGDVVAKSVAKKIGRKCDFEFAPIDASIEAVQRGLNVLFLGSSDKIGEAISAIRDFNSSSIDKIEYELIRTGKSGNR
jgi:putative transcriptional regulator